MSETNPLPKVLPKVLQNIVVEYLDHNCYFADPTHYNSCVNCLCLRDGVNADRDFGRYNEPNLSTATWNTWKGACEVSKCWACDVCYPMLLNHVAKNYEPRYWVMIK